MLQLLRELRDLPSSLIEAYATDRLLGGNISMNEEPISPSTRWQAFLGMLPFLAFGASSVIGKVDHTYHLRGHYAALVVYSLALAGLLIGWIRGFPLWSYGYLGWSFLLAWDNTNIRVAPHLTVLKYTIEQQALSWHVRSALAALEASNAAGAPETIAVLQQTKGGR